jgi:hypothetical protein
MVGKHIRTTFTPSSWRLQNMVDAAMEKFDAAREQAIAARADARMERALLAIARARQGRKA